MSIDWVTVSEIGFTALIQALFGVLIVFVTFRLGQRESNRNWQRQLDKIFEEKRSDRTLRYIQAIHEIIDYQGTFETRVNNGSQFTDDEKIKVKSVVIKAKSIFEKSGNPRVKYYLRGLHYLILRESPIEVQEIQKRSDLVKKMFDGLKTELDELEGSLYQFENDDFSSN